MELADKWLSRAVIFWLKLDKKIVWPTFYIKIIHRVRSAFNFEPLHISLFLLHFLVIF